MFKRLFVLILLCQFTKSYGQNDSVFCDQITALQELINSSHYSPKLVNDSLSKGVFELFLKQLDDDKRYFIQGDIDVFKEDQYEIDNYITSNSCDFITKYGKTLQRRIESTKQIVSALQDENLDYSGKDTLYFKPNDEHGYFKDEAAVKRFWDKRIRYLIINKLIEEDSVFSNIRANFKVLEKELKPKIIQNQLCLLDEFSHQRGKLDTFVKETFLNAMMNYEDPNSSFFNDSDKMLFESSVTNNQMSFGISTLKNDDGQIVIAYILPGGAASKNGNLEENDVIISLESGTDILEIYCVSNEDIQAFINDERHAIVNFKIKKSNGTIQDVKLTKAITKIEENTIRGYILQNKTDFGYIKIPSFYTDLESPNGLGLANDVAKELYKLNKENINGLVIDLRFNGGGSMKEAAELSGMFIDRGPLSIIKYPDGQTYTIRDMNRGSLFTKPIVVLMNNYSASASEFFASVMQDYGRAIIVGSPSHGKSSAQVILPLSETEDLGFCKITVEKFYRVTGLSHQSVGVIPDIALPSLYDVFKTNEKFESYALANDSVKVTMKHRPFKLFKIASINEKSLKRTENNSSFKAIQKLNTIVENDYINKTGEYPLTLDDIYNDLEGYNTLWTDFYSELELLAPTITAKNTMATDEILQYNDEDAEANTFVLQDIQNDIYIEEAYSILLDMINSKTNN